jgi:beta-carotene hydroxylase
MAFDDVMLGRWMGATGRPGDANVNAFSAPFVRCAFPGEISGGSPTHRREEKANGRRVGFGAIVCPMKPRFAADYRTLCWAYGLFPVVVFAPYVRPSLVPWMLPLAMYVGFCGGVFAHNHNHCPTFYGRAANAFHAAWISIFYGHPTFAWIPTHNLNHHKFMNRPGDATITWRYSKKNTWLVASTYFFVSAYWQHAVTKTFVARAKAMSPRVYAQIGVQTRVFLSAHAAAFLLAVALHGWRLGPLVYAGTFGASAAMGLWGMIFVNFIQHVHCDPWSAHDHSRNFVSTLGNYFVFNSGFHTVHHEHPGTHWSELPSLHAKIAHLIHPDLRQSNIFGYCFRAYLLGAFFDRFRTRQIGRPAHVTPA